MNNPELIRSNIIGDMSEGVMVLGLDGVIEYVNPAAESILDIPSGELTGRRFARCFFEHPENDAFNQCILDAVYDSGTSHKNTAPYFTGRETRQLHITTSYLHDGDRRVGVIAVLSDISELSELRDAVKAMERIRALNDQLEIRNRLLNEAFGRFLSDEIVRQLLDTPDGLALGGKKRTLTVMMSDLRGFTAISERMPAAGLLGMLNHYLGEMTEIIQQYNGTIIEFIGDGIMAIFGAPVPSETHAADAVAAAVAMQARMDSVNEWNRQRGYPALEMGVGLNTGEVIVGNIGSEKRTKYGVVGNQVNLCGRIESYTVGGQVLISPRTRQEAGVELVIAGEQQVFPKGAARPLVVSHVTGVGAPYFLSCERPDDAPVPLEAPVDVRFVTVHDKHCGAESLSGRFTALSDHGALLETDAPLAPFDNLRIDAGGELFAKALRRNASGWLLRFTALPDGWSAETLKA